MPDRFCPSCGTEVEADARFCPSCGTTLATDGEEATAAPEAELPAAPAWPAEQAMVEPEPSSSEPTTAEPPLAGPSLPGPPPADAAGEDQPTLADATVAVPGPSAAADVPAAAPPPMPAAPVPLAPGGHAAGSSVAPVTTSSDIPVTWPTTIAGWLIGAGSLLGAIFLIASLGNVVSLVLFVALLGIAATIFAANRMPQIPHLRLLVLATTMIGLGVGLARAGFTVAGADTLFLLAMLAASGGALLIELERDRPWPPAERNGG